MSDNFAEMRARKGADMVNVFVPTTPNPTTGFLIVVDRGEILMMDTTRGRGVQDDFHAGRHHPGRAGRKAPGQRSCAATTPLVTSSV